MVVYAKSEELQNLYDNTYPEDDVEAVEFMCGEYADGWEAVAALLGDQRDALNADTKLLASEKKDLEVKLGSRSNAALIKMMHGLLTADLSFDSMTAKEMKEETLFGVVQRECRDSQVSVIGVEHDILGMKRRLYDRRRWVWDLQEEQVQWDVKAILSRREDEELGTVYRVQWSDDTVTEEPASSLVNVPEMVAEFDRAEQAKKRRSTRAGSRRASAKKVKYAKEGKADQETEKEVVLDGSGAGEMSEMQKLMVVLGNTMATLASNAAAAGGRKAGNEESKSEADGSEWKLPGMRDLMGGAKRMKEVGVEHFMEERTLLRTRRSVMMDVHLPFADIYNEKMSLLVAIEQRKMECRHQLRDMRSRAVTEALDEQIERKKIRKEMIEEEWMVVDDTLTLLQECSDAAMDGNVAGAWQVWEDAQEEQKGSQKSKAFKTRMPAASVKLKEKAKTDQATFVAMQLGVQSSWYGGEMGI